MLASFIERYHIGLQLAPQLLHTHRFEYTALAYFHVQCLVTTSRVGHRPTIVDISKNVMTDIFDGIVRRVRRLQGTVSIVKCRVLGTEMP
jgi:hypothetical protein